MKVLISTQLETVATWAGLLTGVAGTVLAVVAIWFAATVDRRSREASHMTIQSMQKVESAVERISTDTGGLIRAAWERMLGTVGYPDNSVPSGPVATGMDEETTKSIAAGIAAELRAELLPPGTASPTPDESESLAPTEHSSGDDSHATGEDHVQRLNDIVERLERTVRAQLRQTDQGANPVEDGMRILARLSPLARGLIRALANSRHLERKEYQYLRRWPDVRDAANELRAAGLLSPLRDEDDTESVVYWIPRGRLPALGAALLTTPPDSSDVVERVEMALRESGHSARVAHARKDYEEWRRRQKD